MRKALTESANQHMLSIELSSSATQSLQTMKYHWHARLPVGAYTPYVPKTDEERNEAFGLLDELLKELGREEALRRELARSLLKLPLEELEPEELRKELRRAH